MRSHPVKSLKMILGVTILSQLEMMRLMSLPNRKMMNMRTTGIGTTITWITMTGLIGD
jgi:hypothetical protein